MSGTLEELIIGKKIGWSDLEYEDDNARTFTVHHFSGTIIYLGSDYVIAQLDDNPRRKCLGLYDLAQLVENDRQGMEIRYAISRHMGDLRRAEEKAKRAADHTPHVIYALADPRDTSVHYVGISKDMERRFKQHIHRDGKNVRKNAWILTLQEQGLQPSLIILEETTGRYNTLQREEYWNRYYLRQNAPLTNSEALWIANVMASEAVEVAS